MGLNWTGLVGGGVWPEREIRLLFESGAIS